MLSELRTGDDGGFHRRPIRRRGAQGHARGLYPLNTNVAETLTYLEADYGVKPLLAERWELQEPNTWRFYLRKGVTFHDGQPLNAAAVKTGLFDRVAAAGGGTINAGPESAVVVDEMTIDFTPTKPNLRVPEQIVHPQNAVIAPGSDLTKQAVGTGPFRFVEYLPKERIVVERNADYWGDKARLERITFRFYPDSSARRLALEAGEIDFAFQVPRDDVEGLKQKGFKIENSPVGAYEAMYANVHSPAPRDILTDVQVRKAIAMGIDRKKLVNGVLNGLASTDQTYIPPNALGDHADAIEGYEFNPSKAKSLLRRHPREGRAPAQAHPRVRLSFRRGTPPHPDVPAVGAQEDRRRDRHRRAPGLGFVPGGHHQRTADLYLEQGNQNDANPGFLPVLLFYTGSTGADAPYQKLFAPGEKFDKLIEPSLTERDPDEVQRIVAEALSEAIDEQVTIIPLAGIFRIYGMKKGVEGFVPHPAFLHVRWDEVSLS